MSIILKCDVSKCESNSFSYRGMIWACSSMMEKEYKLKHICNSCLEVLKIDVIEDHLNGSIYLEEESKIDGPIEKVSIYSDGACKGNPGLSGSGLAIYIDGKVPFIRFGDFDPTGTNNSAELLAMLSALEYAEPFTKNSVSVEILSDSQYSINSVTKWANTWESNGWKKKGGEIKNLSLIKRCFYLYNAIKSNLTISYVKAHSGIIGNELADRAAGLAIVHKTSGWDEMKDIDINKILAL